MTSEELIEEYKNEFYISSIRDIEHFRIWAENRLEKVMPRPLFIAQGKGGGQTYKTLWEVFDVRHNKGIHCYFYNQNKKAIDELEKSGHLPLQHWIDDKNPRLFRPKRNRK